MEADFELAALRANEERDAGIRRACDAIAGNGRDDCEDCGSPIDIRRREAMPSATRCIDCQRMLERLRIAR